MYKHDVFDGKNRQAINIFPPQSIYYWVKGSTRRSKILGFSLVKFQFISNTLQCLQCLQSWYKLKYLHSSACIIKRLWLSEGDNFFSLGCSTFWLFSRSLPQCKSHQQSLTEGQKYELKGQARSLIWMSSMCRDLSHFYHTDWDT